MERKILVGLVAALLVPLPGKCGTAWTEAWERAAVGSYIPTDGGQVTISGDKGKWYLADTASSDGPSPNKAEIILVGGKKSLKMVTVENGSGAANNLYIVFGGHPGMAITP